MFTIDNNALPKNIPGRKSGGSAHMLKRIGSTTYAVGVHFSTKSNESLEDKLLRLIESGVKKHA
jgi:hypothetical protein